MDGSQEIEFVEFVDVLTGKVPLDGSVRNTKHTIGGGGRSILEIRQQFNSSEPCFRPELPTAYADGASAALLALDL